MQGAQVTRRSLVVVLLVAISEVAWALYCAVNDEVSIALFYGVLVAASALFFVPGLLEQRHGVA